MGLSELPGRRQSVNHDVVRRGIPLDAGVSELRENGEQHIQRGNAGEEGVAGVDGDEDPISSEAMEEGPGFVELADAGGEAEGEVEDGGVGAPVLVGVDEVVDEMCVRGEAAGDEIASVGRGGVGGEEDVGGDGEGLGREAEALVGEGAAPAEEGEEEGGVGAEVGEGPEEVIGAEGGSEGAEDGVDAIVIGGGGMKEEALLESGGEVEDEISVSDGGLLWDIIWEGTAAAAAPLRGGG